MGAFDFNEKIFKMLLDHGANVNIVDELGHSLIHLAVVQGNSKAV